MEKKESFSIVESWIKFFSVQQIVNTRTNGKLKSVKKRARKKSFELQAEWQ